MSPAFFQSQWKSNSNRREFNNCSRSSLFLTPNLSLFLSMSVCRSLALSLSLIFYQSMLVSLSFSVSLSVSLSLSMSFCRSLSLSLGLFLCQSVSLIFCQSFCRFFSLSLSFSTSVCLSVSLFLSLPPSCPSPRRGVLPAWLGHMVLPRQCCWSPSIDQPDLTAMASTNSCLLRIETFVFIGKVVTHFEAPISRAISIFLLISFDNWAIVSCSSAFVIAFLSFSVVILCSLCVYVSQEVEYGRGISLT